MPALRRSVQLGLLCVALIILSGVGTSSSYSQTTSVNRVPKQPLKLLSPNGLALDGQGELFISDIGAHCIFKLDRRGRLTLVAGTGEAGFSGDGGPAKSARLRSPHDLLVDQQGNLLVADTGNQRIRRIDERGLITTVAGDGRPLQSNYNGVAPPLSLNNPQGLALAADGSLLIADTYNHVVRCLDQQGKLTILAGSVAGYGGDGGPAEKAQLNLPMAVAVSPDGIVFISDAGNSRLRRVAADGRIQTVAGYGPAQDTYGAGFAGDGGPLEKAKFFSPTDLKFDAAGQLFICDSGNHRIRAWRQNAVTTVAGNGQLGFGGDGQVATAATLNSPQKLALTKDGGFFIADRANQRVRHVDARGVIRTIVSYANAGRSMAGAGRPVGQRVEPASIR
jgi:sugar lactone lactonase YvrE